jgi:hypothetical protein
MPALDQLLKDEQAHVTAINKLEEERTSAAMKIVPSAENPSLLDLAELAENDYKVALLKLRDELLEVVAEIKSRNELNQQLIHQSMQFINFSRSLVLPQQKEFNYGPPAGKKTQPEKSPGMFNTKA